MKIYHGTAPEHIEAIRRNGIQPREETGHSNWDDNDMQSRPEHVYLSEPFAPYYAMAASDGSEIAVVEVETDELNERDLFPDEDFIEQAIRSDELDIHHPSKMIDLDGSIAERTAAVRENIMVFQPYWEASLDVLGNVSHRGSIPPKAITRVTIADLPRNLRMNIDPVIEIHAVQAIRSKYETITELVIGGDVSTEEYVAAVMGVPVPDGMQVNDVLDNDDVSELIASCKGNVRGVVEQEYVTVVKSSD